MNEFVSNARKNGYSDDQIAQIIAENEGLDLSGELKNGLNYSQIIDKWTAPPPPSQSQFQMDFRFSPEFGAAAGASLGAGATLAGQGIMAGARKLGIPQYIASLPKTPTDGVPELKPNVLQRPHEVAARFLAQGEASNPYLPKGPSDVINWASGKGTGTGQYTRGYMGGASQDIEANLHRQADLLEAKNPGFKVIPGDPSLQLKPAAEVDQMIAQRAADTAAYRQQVEARANQAAEARRQKLGELQAGRKSFSYRAPQIPGKVASSLPVAGAAFGANLSDIISQSDDGQGITPQDVISGAGALSSLAMPFMNKLPPKLKWAAPATAIGAPFVNRGLDALQEKADGGWIKKLQAVLPKAQRQANLQSMMGKSVEPQQMYHGTRASVTGDQGLTQFKPNPENGLTFVTPDPKFAERYMYTPGKGTEGGAIYPVNVQVTNPFDYQNPQHVNALAGALKKPSLRSEFASGDWRRLEYPETIKAIKGLGHDAMYMEEYGTKNLGLFDPNKIKSSIGNRGTYDTSVPDINMATGGSVPGYADGKIVKQMSDFVRGYLHNTKVNPNPLVGTRYNVKDLGGLTPVKPIELESLRDKMIQTNPWDVMSRNYQINSVSGVPLTSPIITHGGQGYTRDLQHILDEIGGASNEGIAKRVQNRANQASREGIQLGGTGEVVNMPSTMAPSSVNFAMPTTQIYMDLLKQAELSPQRLKELSNFLKVNPKHANMFDLSDPRVMSSFESSPTFRKSFLEMMQNKAGQKLLNVNTEDVLAAMRDPNLAGVPAGFMGHTGINMQPGASIRPSKNITYSHDVPGTYAGSLPHTPVSVMLNKPFQPIADQLRKQYPNASESQIIGWASDALGKRSKNVSELVNDEMINRVGQYHEGLKQGKFAMEDVPGALKYLSTPGVYAEGGAVQGYADGKSVIKAITEPMKTVKAYKLFRTDPKQPESLYPLFVNANEPVSVGQWLEAKAGEMVGDKVKSKLGPLAYRPGWHAGDLPVATHIGSKSDPALKAPDTRPSNQVWAEVEMPADVDWQAIALERATRNKRGEIIPRTAHITDQVPLGGHYRYKTNPNMTGDWMIGGSMKVNRVLTDDEVRAINEAAGVSDLPRREGFAEGGLTTPNSSISEEEELRRFNAAQGGEQPWYSKALPMEGRATFLPFRDTMEGSVFNKRELALPGILAGAVNAFTSPARALTGSDPTFKPGEEAANMALNTFGGGVALGRVASPPPSGSLGMNIGPNAANWDAAAYNRALKLKEMGLGQNEIKAVTGNEQMPGSGVWSQLMSDKNSRAYPHKLPEINTSGNLFDQMNAGRPITEVFHHPEFFKAYPEAKNIRVATEPGSGASYQSSMGGATIYVGDKIKDPEQLRTRLLHELQHYVQTKENWPRGGNVDEMMPGLIKNPQSKLRTNPVTKDAMSVFDTLVNTPKAIKKYMNLEGEAQARATETGKNLDATQQRVTPTQERYDRPLGGLDTRYGFAEGGHTTPAWQRSEGKNPEGGLNAAGRASYNRETGGNLQPPVSAEAAKSSPKKAARRKSFCARMEGNSGPMKDENGKPTRKALALRKWDC